MTRNISSLFSEVKIDTDTIRKYLGTPIILQLSEDIEQENEGDTFCGILTDVENNQIYMEKTSSCKKLNNASELDREKPQS